MDTTFQNIQYRPSSVGQSVFEPDETPFPWSRPSLAPSVGQNTRFNFNMNSANSDVSKQHKLPQFLAPSNVHHKLQSLGLNKHLVCNFIMSFAFTASSYEDPHHKKKTDYKKTIYVRTTTTKPPIVWFPGDPDCGEGDLGGNSRIDTFQLIAFLLSVFNVASIMASNVNNNNNNNNINDNDDSFNDNNINESNTNAEVMSMSNVGLGGRKKRSTKDDEDLQSTVWDTMKMVMKSHVTRSITCLEKLFCESSQTAARRGGMSYVTAEMSSLLLAKSLPNLKQSYRQRLVLAGKYGRSGLDCQKIFDNCEQENWNFANLVESFMWSSVADRNSVEKMVNWAYNK